MKTGDQGVENRIRVLAKIEPFKTNRDEKQDQLEQEVKTNKDAMVDI